MTECFFGCGDSEKELTVAGSERISSIIYASKCRQDNKHVYLEKTLLIDKDFSISCHRDCVSTYTSPCHINRHLKRSGISPATSKVPVKHTRRSDVEVFNFREKCFYCGEICTLKPDPKNPKRWQKALLCRTVDRPGKATFKETILSVCEARDDDWAKRVEVRIRGAVSDLHAADARYHDKCRKKL